MFIEGDFDFAAGREAGGQADADICLTTWFTLTE